jgi:hypothetical protein
VRTGVVYVPLDAFVPLQSPEAVHDDTLVVFQERAPVIQDNAWYDVCHCETFVTLSLFIQKISSDGGRRVIRIVLSMLLPLFVQVTV